MDSFAIFLKVVGGFFFLSGIVCACNPSLFWRIGVNVSRWGGFFLGLVVWFPLVILANHIQLRQFENKMEVEYLARQADAIEAFKDKVNNVIDGNPEYASLIRGYRVNGFVLSDSSRLLAEQGKNEPYVGYVDKLQNSGDPETKSFVFLTLDKAGGAAVNLALYIQPRDTMASILVMSAYTEAFQNESSGMQIREVVSGLVNSAVITPYQSSEKKVGRYSYKVLYESKDNRFFFSVGR